MYLNIGHDTVLLSRDIVGFFDLDNISGSARAKRFLRAAEKAGLVSLIGSDIPKSLVLYEREGKTKVLLTQLSSATLKARAEQ